MQVHVEDGDMPEYWWCLTHGRVEQGAVCRAENRLGPYTSDAEARAWRERRDAREETWEAEDKRWRGEDAED